MDMRQLVRSNPQRRRAPGIHEKSQDNLNARTLNPDTRISIITEAPSVASYRKTFTTSSDWLESQHLQLSSERETHRERTMQRDKFFQLTKWRNGHWSEVLCVCGQALVRMGSGWFEYSTQVQCHGSAVFALKCLCMCLCVYIPAHACVLYLYDLSYTSDLFKNAITS